MSDEEPETREAKEKGIESAPKQQSTPPPGGWSERDDESHPREPDDEKSD